jgi:putative PIN family toxin of toxin-antitoxin system
MRAVVDTNILVSGMLRSDSPPAAVLRDIAAFRLTPVVCDTVLAEYRDVLQRPRLALNGADIRELLALIEQMSEWVNVPEYAGLPVLPDATDWPFIACALAAACPVITGNQKHFPSTSGVRVMSAREWVDRGSR